MWQIHVPKVVPLADTVGVCPRRKSSSRKSLPADKVRPYRATPGQPQGSGSWDLVNGLVTLASEGGADRSGWEGLQGISQGKG